LGSDGDNLNCLAMHLTHLSSSVECNPFCKFFMYIFNSTIVSFYLFFYFYRELTLFHKINYGRYNYSVRTSFFFAQLEFCGEKY
jgi:hypothetical protein